jgi:hypothetical protein
VGDTVSVEVTETFIDGRVYLGVAKPPGAAFEPIHSPGRANRLRDGSGGRGRATPHRAASQRGHRPARRDGDVTPC